MWRRRPIKRTRTTRAPHEGARVGSLVVVASVDLALEAHVIHSPSVRRGACNTVPGLLVFPSDRPEAYGLRAWGSASRTSVQAGAPACRARGARWPCSTATPPAATASVRRQARRAPARGGVDRGGKPHDEARAAAVERRLERDGAAVGLGDGADDRRARGPRAAPVRRAPEEALEDPVGELGRDAGAVVLDRSTTSAVARARRSPRPRVAGSVWRSAFSIRLSAEPVQLVARALDRRARAARRR